MSTTRKKVLKTVAGILIFLFLLTTIINFLGPLLRPEGQDFDGWHYFYAEDNNTINAAMIGSSAMYRYWIPAQAYEEQGFTSCMISQSCQNIRAVPYIMEETLKSQDVDLFVVELRQVVADLVRNENLTEEKIEKQNYYLSILTSGMKQSKTRRKLIHELLIPTEADNELEWQIPLLKYHENVFEISKNDWIDRFATGKSIYKGLRVRTTVDSQEKPTIFPDAENATFPLPQKSREYIDDIVKTAEKYGKKILFVSTPYICEEARFPYQCAMNAYMAEKNYPYLNMEEKSVRESVDLDYSIDFYNPHHVNVVGAEKITAYLAEYMKEHYQFTDKLNEKQKKEWNHAVSAWNEKEIQYRQEWNENCKQAALAEASE